VPTAANDSWVFVGEVCGRWGLQELAEPDLGPVQAARQGADRGRGLARHPLQHLCHPVDLRPHIVGRMGPAWTRWSTLRLSLNGSCQGGAFLGRHDRCSCRGWCRLRCSTGVGRGRR
jgi:hypothetical protein